MNEVFRIEDRRSLKCVTGTGVDGLTSRAGELLGMTMEINVVWPAREASRGALRMTVST